jgi:hypothetical protein
VAGSPLQEAYVELLLDRVREESYPNPEHLNRIEAAIRTPEQLAAYLEVLLSRVEAMPHPSPSMLDRIARFVAMT